MRLGAVQGRREVSEAWLVRSEAWVEASELPLVARQWPAWVGALTGKMGERSAEGFVLVEPAIQVFEKKAKGEPAG